MEPGTSIGDYALVERVHEGAISEVFRAEKDGRTHAIKILTARSDEQRERLMLEGRTLTMLRHPNLVPVTDLVFTGNRAGIVMDWLSGPTLDVWADAKPDFDRVERVLRGLMDGVERLHKANLVHRDLNPTNVIIVGSGKAEVARIVDLGSIKKRTLAMTRPGTMIGTRGYMAPEQIQGAEVDARTDVFGLGCLLYRMSCGRGPFDAPTDLSSFEAVAAGEYLDPRSVRSDLPTRLARVIKMCLATAPDERPQNVDAIRGLMRRSMFGGGRRKRKRLTG